MNEPCDLSVGKHHFPSIFLSQLYFQRHTSDFKHVILENLHIYVYSHTAPSLVIFQIPIRIFTLLHGVWLIKIAKVSYAYYKAAYQPQQSWEWCI